MDNLETVKNKGDMPQAKYGDQSYWVRETACRTLISGGVLGARCQLHSGSGFRPYKDPENGGTRICIDLQRKFPERQYNDLFGTVGDDRKVGYGKCYAEKNLTPEEIKEL
ncbi:hypothetical protein AMATHDRAFT_64621, partial [Amanita thiersii Skay4041]